MLYKKLNLKLIQNFINLYLNLQQFFQIFLFKINSNFLM